MQKLILHCVLCLRKLVAVELAGNHTGNVMSELDQSINDAEKELHDMQSRTHSKTPNRKKKLNITVLMLVVSIVVISYQLSALSEWMFGLPEDTVQSDIMKLLGNADEQMQAVSADGQYPETLPGNMPKWLLGYKKTLAGYKIDTKIDGVSMQLVRDGDNVTIQRLE